MRRSRTAIVVALAILLAILLAWWLFQEEPPPVFEPPPVPEAPAPEFAPDEPAPPPVPTATEIPLATATIRVLDAMHGEASRESLLDAESVASAPGPALVVEDAGSGTWTVRGPSGSIVRYVASAAGSVPAEGWFTLGRREEIPVHLSPVAPCFLRVVNVDDGKPVPGATLLVTGDPVLFRGRNAARTWRGRTDSDGLASCPEGGPGRRLQVTAMAPGFASASMDVDSPPEEVLVPLDPARDLPLIVADDRGTPIQGALVRPAGFEGRPLLPPEFAVETDRAGLARIPLPRRMPLRARTAVLVEVPARPPRYVLLPAEEEAPATVTIPRPWPGGITVVEGPGAPRAGVPVRLLPLAASGVPLRDLGVEFLGLTDARGRVTLPAPMAEARYLASVGGAGDLFLVSRFLRTEDLRSFPEMRSLPAVDLAVRVTGAGGAPLDAAEVLLVPPDSRDDPPEPSDLALEMAPPARTGPDGIASLRVPPVPSTALVVAGPFAWRFVPWDGNRKELAVDLPSNPVLAVRVEDGAGHPVAGARVRVRPGRQAIVPPALRGRAVQEAITGPKGTVAFEAPAGCHLEIRAEGRGALDAAELEVPPMEPGGGTATLTLATARTAWIVVERPDGDRLRHASVEVSYEGLGARWLGVLATGEQGVLPVPAPAKDSPSPNDRAVFMRLGTERTWGTLAVGGLVDGARVVLTPTDQEVYVLRIEESPLWPRGTPIRWRLVDASLKTTLRAGRARVGVECPLLLGRDPKGTLLLELPDSTPFLRTDLETSAKLRESFYADLAKEQLRSKDGSKDGSKPRPPRLPASSPSADTNWSFPSLRPLELFNETDGWARARIVAGRRGRWKEGVVGWTSAPLAPGQRARCLVTIEDDWTVEWAPVLPLK